ncbi:MAG: hypothetical protein JKY65_09995 [Planctomycetes bacterium]|nr:hypothetical protein [Planctomycetota bacterium]
MRDDTLRELEREWRATRDLELEQTYLQALVRNGLPKERLLLAAYLGCEVALGLLGDQGFAEEKVLTPWVAGLGLGRLARKKAFSRESSIRAALGALAFLATSGKRDPDAESAAALVAAWLEDPSEEARLAVRGLRKVGALSGELAGVVLVRSVEDAARAAARVATQVARELRGVHPSNQLAVRGAIYRTLLPWALSSEALTPT